jgi:hypothetical protein
VDCTKLDRSRGALLSNGSVRAISSAIYASFIVSIGALSRGFIPRASSSRRGFLRQGHRALISTLVGVSTGSGRNAGTSSIYRGNRGKEEEAAAVGPKCRFPRMSVLDTRESLATNAKDEERIPSHSRTIAVQSL